MIIIDKLVKRFGFFEVLNQASWQVPDRGIYGFVGENGAGKSTLLKILALEEGYDGGEVIVPKGVTIGYLPQEIAALEEGPLLKVVESGRQDLIDMEASLQQMQKELDAHPTQDLISKFAVAQEKFERLGGYEFRAKARQVLTGIGFKASQFETPISSFSGGWQMRAMLARLLLASPSVLLLDEPTNHLDLETIEWLEAFLSRYEGTVVVVSHDRFFLNRMVSGIVELERGKITTYVGNYDEYREEKALQRERLAKAAAHQKKEIDKIELFIERFRSKATKAKQVQSRVRMLEKTERIQGPESELDSIHFKFPQPRRLPRLVVETKGLSKAYSNKVLYDGLDLIIERGDKVALVGPNGAGKTTLMKMIAGLVAPDRGTIELGPNVELAYFSQHAVEQLDPNKSVLDELWDVDTSKSQTEIRNLLGAFRFRGDDVTKQVQVLSGGEKSRLALAKLILKPGGLLLLDEPTNHLDIGSRQTLEFALNTFEGVFIVISHDRYFVDEVANRIIHIEDGEVTDYVGTYSYYLEKRKELASAQEASTTQENEATGQDQSRISKKELRQKQAEIRKLRDAEMGNLKKDLKKIEKSIATAEAEIEEIDEAFAQGEIYEDHAAMNRLSKRKSDLEADLEGWMMEWEELAIQIESIEEKYQQQIDLL